MKILRDQPATLQCAVAVATNEQNLRACVQMSHHSGYMSKHAQNTPHAQHTPMEVDHSRGQRFKARPRFNRVNSTGESQDRCWRCCQTGHISQDCKAKKLGDHQWVMVGLDPHIKESSRKTRVLFTY